jgi:arginine utilization regulatory protein
LKIKQFKKIVEDILQNIEEGIHVVDSNGKTVMYNHKMADLEQMQRKDVLEKLFRDAFPNLKDHESTLILALEAGITTKDKQQTYLNKDGIEITTLSTTIPVTDGDNIVGAIEIAKDRTDMQKMAGAIIKLKSKPASEKKGRGAGIKKYTFDSLIGENQKFKELIYTAKRAVNSQSSVLISGETGTGKELIAQSIHYAGKRKHKPFIAQNCAALPVNLLEGILFGTVKGGYTGAVDRAGLFEQAEGGTLLLDEISAMPYELQGKLLRVLQEDYIRRVGGMTDIPIDVRIMATINEPASALIESGRLRKDLFYRINIISLDAIPLRDRSDDIPLLAQFFLKKHSEKNNRNMDMISVDALTKLTSYEYPGNIRELENIIMAAVSMADDGHVLKGEDIRIPESHRYTETAANRAFDSSEETLDIYLENIEVEIIQETLKLNGGNISKTAATLGMKRQTLQHKLRKYALI